MSGGVVRSGPPIAYVGTSSFTGCRPLLVKLLIRQRRQLCEQFVSIFRHVPDAYRTTLDTDQGSQRRGTRSQAMVVAGRTRAGCALQPRPLARASAPPPGAHFFLTPVVQYCGRITRVTRTRQAGRRQSHAGLSVPARCRQVVDKRSCSSARHQRPCSRDGGVNGGAMPIPIPSSLIEFILLGPADDRRQLQDSPILGDVWVAFGASPADKQDLLISPFMTQHAGKVAEEIELALGGDDGGANIAYLQGLVAARLSFQELVSVVVPKTQWWIDKWTRDVEPRSKAPADAPGAAAKPEFRHAITRRFGGADGAARLHDVLAAILQSVQQRLYKKAQPQDPEGRRPPEATPFDRFVALAGLILWAAREQPDGKATTPEYLQNCISEKAEAVIQGIAGLLVTLSEKMLADESWRKKDGGKAKPLIWQISLNRKALPALVRSVPAVKADAAMTLFKVKCGEIAWAVLDSGIDGDHPAFAKPGGGRRVKRSFNFANFRKIVNLSNSKPIVRKRNLEDLLKVDGLLLNPYGDCEKPAEFLARADADLEQLASSKWRGAIQWDLVEKFVEIDPKTNPVSSHGTHVAGIIGASKATALKIAGIEEDRGIDAEDIGIADGMCPGHLALRLPRPGERPQGHGVRDHRGAAVHPVPERAQQLHHDPRRQSQPVDPARRAQLRLRPHAGLQRVRAAGRQRRRRGRGGRQSRLPELRDQGRRVRELRGLQHHRSRQCRRRDHGRLDAPLLAAHLRRELLLQPRTDRRRPPEARPGRAGRAHPGAVSRRTTGAWGDLDGTSMAAPHVSGAAAMLMARYSELIGQPRRIKRILCESATDLGRERSFQGHGMLDVLRAFQSI